MNEFKFENQGTNTFLVYHLKPEDEIDTFSYGMISNNSIYGIVSTILVQMDHDKYLKFNVSSKISLEQYFMGVVNKQRFLNVFSNIATAILASEEYMLETSTFLLDPKYIFVNVGTEEAEIICFPVLGKESPVELVKFFKDIVFGTQFDQSENADYVAKIISFLNGSNNFSLVDFKNLLTELLEKPKKMPEVKREDIVPPKVIPDFAATIAQPSITPVYNIPDSSEEKMNLNLPKGKFKFNLFGGNKGKEGTENKIKEKKKEKKIKESKPKEKKVKRGGLGNSKMAIPGMAIPGMEEKPQESVPFEQLVQPVPATPSAPVTPKPMFAQPEKVQPAPIPLRPLPINPVMNQMVPGTAGETTVLNEVTSGETTVLSEHNSLQNIRPHLIRHINNEVIQINKQVFKLGKERSFVDYCIGNNPAVSRSHANIIKKGEAFYIMDMNSKNRTYVNETMIPSNTEVEITHGCMIRLANEEFEFKVR
ncbi:pSer/pThr/pTyr-binding forkhead associated (FHA) protein [Mobilisporobacter senegalensis]|uniref:PSer/pThr/pTyr-binding forkhead associated (FHA) protein n=1 Tax=Mobilisporobacter senegalensis TaxID=1329262 RepID=A0A3N1XUU5_9FIRM|nr:DUF6382 domain-containing protein [Mobilisporobacter senegalensis]ROR28677.1 pSer/pThr/pTyr-binding forkhead associated (FHA) protein [Mobilisporobacter senegalensis]